MTEAVIWKGADEFEAFLRPLEELKPHAENPRRGDVQLVKESLRLFGQQKPVITDRDDHDLIVAGHHLYHAARSLGWTHVAAIELWSEAQDGDRYLLIDNATSDNSTYDQEVLLGMLKAEEDLPATGFTADEREQLRVEVEEMRRARAEFEAGRDTDTRPAPDPTGEPAIRNLLLRDLDDAAFEHMATHLKVLQREWGIIGNSELVAEAVRREVLRLREGEPDE